MNTPPLTPAQRQHRRRERATRYEFSTTDREVVEALAVLVDRYGSITAAIEAAIVTAAARQVTSE